MTLCCYVALLRYVYSQTGSRPCTEVTIGTSRLCIVLVNTRGVQSYEVKDKVFHALANPGIPLSDRQENAVLTLYRKKSPRGVIILNVTP